MAKVVLQCQPIDSCYTTVWQRKYGAVGCPISGRTTTINAVGPATRLSDSGLFSNGALRLRVQSVKKDLGKISLAVRCSAKVGTNRKQPAECNPVERPNRVVGIEPATNLFGPAFTLAGAMQLEDTGGLEDNRVVEASKKAPTLVEGCPPLALPLDANSHILSGFCNVQPATGRGDVVDALSADRHTLKASLQASPDAPLVFPDSIRMRLSSNSSITTVEESPPENYVQKIQTMLVGTARFLGALLLAAAIALFTPRSAMAARSMGRAGGGGFSSSRSSGGSSHSSSSTSGFSTSSTSGFSSSFTSSRSSSSRSRSSTHSRFQPSAQHIRSDDTKEPNPDIQAHCDAAAKRQLYLDAYGLRKEPVKGWLQQRIAADERDMFCIFVVYLVMIYKYVTANSGWYDRAEYTRPSSYYHNRTGSPAGGAERDIADVYESRTPKRKGAYSSEADGKNLITVVRIQVALLGQAKSVQTQMNMLCEEADTSSKKGLHKLLSETLLVILRHVAYWAYRTTQADAMGYEAAERRFQQIALEERSKAEQETLVNKDGQLTKAPSVRNADEEPPPNEFIVVTVLAAVKGRLEAQAGTGAGVARESVKGAIQALSRVQAEDIEVLEILWVPQEDDDTLTHAELVENFTDLSPL